MARHNNNDTWPPKHPLLTYIEYQPEYIYTKSVLRRHPEATKTVAATEGYQFMHSIDAGITVAVVAFLVVIFFGILLTQ